MSLLTFTTIYAQRPASGPPLTAGEEKVFLLGADSITINKLPDGTEIRRVVNKVIFRHKGALMYCDLAIHNVASNALEAYGHVKIVQGDTVTVTGDTLFYYGNSRLAKVSGKVVTLKDRKRTVTSNRIEYDMASGVAFYPDRGKTVDAENTLTSKQGYYDTRTKISTYYHDVKLVNKKYTLTTDTLVYNSLTKMADFRSPTKVVSKDGTVIAKNGSYNTETGESVFRTRTTIDNPDYTLTGDSLSFDNLNKKGFAKGNVELVSKNDETILNGDFGQYNGKLGRSKVWGHALTRTVISKDTLFMTADTLYSIEIQGAKALPTKKASKNVIDSDTSDAQKPRQLIGYKNVLLYKKDLQSKCDSLIYNSLDSTITFLKKPIIWSGKYQMEADSIVAQLINQKLRTMYLKAKSFVIAQDTLFNFNQVKGRRITAFFDDSTRLERVFVEGNGESVYFAANEANKPMGMNRVECAKMTLNFKRNQVNRIQFVGQPDGRFIPPQGVKAEDKQLDGFNWRIKEKPTKTDVLAKTNFKPKPPKIVKPIEKPQDKTNQTVKKEVLKTKVKPKLKKL
ncbi:OstA-like protein [Runella sp.]|uniref:OstA-like protein n=1 Tax=Runella sp. TaxID=1960881 RepID=UPI00301870A4